MNSKKITVASLVATTTVVLIASGCDNSNPGPDSDSQQSYSKSDIPVDHSIYTITGTVTSSVSSLVRQTQPAQGSLFGLNSFVTGNFSGPVESGKSFIRLTVENSNPPTDLAPLNSVIIIKATDTKATALAAGDTITFKCRRQYEAVAAVENNENLNIQKDSTWELDFCRLVTPVIVKK